MRAFIKIITYPLQYRRKCPLVPGVHILKILIKLEDSFVFTVDRVVSEVHEHVLQVLLCWFLIGLSAVSCHAFFEEINAKGID